MSGEVSESTPSSKTDDGVPSMKSMLISGAIDFRTVFLYPLCTGIMTGVGFVLGKRLGESYFDSAMKASS